MARHFVLLCLLATAARAAPEEESPSCGADGVSDLNDGCLSLLQRRMEVVAGVSHAAPKPKTSCANLRNHGSFFTVELKVGTPAQKFQVVADTGSDLVIVPSCLCQDVGACSTKDDCFKGNGKSSTFSIPEGPDVGMVQLMFGSGPIDTVIATDVVQMGGQSAVMKDGLLLMVDHGLDFGGPFEGILGLGLPMGPISTSAKTFVPKVFLEEAGVSHFSICFSDSGNPGVLNLGGDPSPLSHGVVGKDHWVLGLRGMPVGSASASVGFCGEKGDCSAILDSGTTAMMGPLNQVNTLFSGLCDAWPRCEKLGADKPQAAFVELLMNCSDWLTKDKGLHELPSINILLAGPTGDPHALELTGWAYVTEALQDEVEIHTKYLGGLIPIDVQVPTGKTEKVCFPSFSATEALSANLDLGSKTHTDWILGTPIFYEYRVGHDLSVDPPAMSFTPIGPDECGSCDEKLGLISEQVTTEATRERPGAARAARAPRQIRGPWRFPSGRGKRGPMV